MKKIIICSILIGVSIFGFISKNKTNSFGIKKTNRNDIKELLKAPDINKQNNTGSIVPQSDYTLLNEFDDNKALKKPDKSINFISKLQDNKTYNASGDETILLAKLIASEAGSEPYVGKLAVASVVLNRAKISNENIRDVIYKNGQFDGINTNNFTKDPDNDSINAAEQALSGQNVLPDAYYYADLKLCNPDFALKSKFIGRIGDHWFFKK